VQEILYKNPRDPEPDARIKAVLVLVGTKPSYGCLPTHVAARPQEPACLHNEFAQMIELYD
jgi:hypothetical protein